MVRPAVSNDPVAVYGIPTTIAARAAARSSSGADMVSIHATSAPPAARPRDLLGERVERFVVGERAERGEQLAGRPDRAGDDDWAGRGVGDFPRELGGAPVELEDAILRVVQLQPMAVPAERVRQDEVGTGVDERPVQLLDALGMVHVPKLGRLPGLETHQEVVRARRAVGEHHPARRQQVFE